jgi:hypothetical protein
MPFRVGCGAFLELGRRTLLNRLRRREFIALLSGPATAWLLSAGAQQPAMLVIGFLRSTSLDGTEHLLAAFRQGLKETRLCQEL